MQLEVRRHLDWSDAVATQGEFFINGDFHGFTLEPPRLDPPTKPRAIPCGTFVVTWAWSPKHQRYLPLLEGVPDFEAIEIHIGDFPRDTLGCLLVGLVRGHDMIAQSTPAVTEAYRLIEAAFADKETVTITYSEIAPAVAA